MWSTNIPRPKETDGISRFTSTEHTFESGNWVTPGTQVATVTLTEPWFLMAQEAELWKLDVNAGPNEYTLATGRK